MENTLENKAKFFAQHLLPGNEFELITQSYYDESDPTASMGIAVKSTGFRFKYDYLITPKAFRYCNGIFPLNMIDKSCIIRKPLSSITDEDAYYIAKLSFREEESHTSEIGKRLVKSVESDNASYFSGALCCTICDYLRSKGYAIRYMGLSVEKQIEYGWVKLELPNA